MSDRVVSVEKFIPATREVIFDLLARPSQHTLIDGSGQLQGEARGPERLTLGDRFGMGMTQAKLAYRTKNTVVEFEEGRLIAWQTSSLVAGRIPIGGQIWRYRLEDAPGGGTLVTEEYDWGESKQARFLPLARFPQRTEVAMRATLERLAATVS